MSAVIPFDFDGFALKVICEGETLLFVAKEVADILEYSDAYEMTKRLDEDEKQNRQIAGFGPRGVSVITESGLYCAILGSRKPEAGRFKKWVTSEVLPSIRKTGSYTAPAAPRASERYREAAAIGHASMKLCKLMGVETNMARVITADLVKKESGIDCSPMLGSNIAVDEKPMTPTELGKHIEISAKRVNALLIEAGLQTKTLDGYEITEAGKAVGCTEPFKSPNSAHVGHRPMWFQRALDPIRALLPDNVVSMTGSGS